MENICRCLRALINFKVYPFSPGSRWETLESCFEISKAMKILKCQWAPIRVLFSFECSAVYTYQVIKVFERGDPDVLLSLIAHSRAAAAVKRREQKNSPIGWHRRFWTKCRRNRFLLLWFRNFSGVQTIYLIQSSVLRMWPDNLENRKMAQETTKDWKAERKENLVSPQDQWGTKTQTQLYI